MSWKKSSAEMIERYQSLVPDDPRVERRTMFGMPVASANGNLFLGLHENRITIRLDENDSALFVKEFKAKQFEPMPGRKSSKTLVVPDRVAADPALLRHWCDKAYAYAVSLPPKKPGAKKKAATTKSKKSKR